MTNTTESKADRIRALNDAFRRTFVGGAVMITARRRSHAPRSAPLALAKNPELRRVQSRTTIPHHEHDFGSIDEAGVRCFWKIDYYDRRPSLARPTPPIPPSRPAS